MRIDSSGRLGLGISSPDAKLHVISGDADTQIKLQSAVSANATSSLLMMSRRGGAENQNVTIKATSGNLSIIGDSGYGKVAIGLASTASVLQLEKTNSSVGTEASPHLQIASGSVRGYSGFHFVDDTAYYIGQNSAIRQLRLYSGAEGAGVVMGNGATSFSSFSDERIKEDVEPISNALQKLADLRCVSYRLKDVDADDSQKKLGIIAQDLVGKVDEVIDLAKRKDDETEYMSVRYTEMIPVLIKAIQELEAEVKALKG